jgi:hypothetical protein
MSSDKIPLPLLPRELSALAGSSPPYRRLYNLVLNGDLPADNDGARWFVDRARLPDIARALGLPAKAA